MTPQQIIDEARVLINDDNALMPERYSDAELLGFVNQAVKRACMVRPDLFITTEDVTPTVGAAAQTLSASITRILELHRVVSGGALGEVDKETMDRSAPDWTIAANDTPVNWMRHARNPRKYFLYPPPATGTVITMEYVKVPSDYILSSSIDLPDSYKSAIIDCVVFLAEVVDNESVQTARAKGFYDSFMQSLGADMAQQTFVDTETHSGAQQPPPRRSQQ